MNQNRLQTFRRGLKLMTPGEMRRAAGILVLIMVTGFLESAIVALVVPIVYVAIDPSGLASTKLGAALHTVFGVPDPRPFFVYLAATLVGLLVASTAISMATRYFSELHGTRCVQRLSAEVLARYMQAPYLWVLGQDTTRISNYLLEDIRIWRRDFLKPLFVIVQSAIMIIAPIAVTLSLAPLGGLIAIGAAAVVALLSVLTLRRKIYNEAKRERERQYVVTKLIRQIVAGLREIRVSNRSAHFLSAFDGAHESYARISARVRVWSEAPTAIVMLLGQIAFLGTGVVLSLSDASRAEIAGQLALIGFVVTRVLPAFNRLANQVPNVTRSVPYVQSIFRLFDSFDGAAPERLSKDAKAIEPGWRTLRLENVSFRYPGAGRPSLRNSDIVLERAGFYGFVGQSGAGKTTLANILLGLIDPTSGAVFIDETPLPALSKSDWQQRFGYVPQDPFILDGSVRENVTFGCQAEDQEIWRALQRARLADVIENLDGKLDAQVGERGKQLSGGQVQRLAIARALLHSPDILFLDEATNSLDTVTEGELLRALNELSHNVMIIMITHRIQSLRLCDRIFLLEDGAIVARGSYQELESASFQFRDLAASDAAVSAV
jgi:ATP-binding cassette, subfamily B, bacterial PglK